MDQLIGGGVTIMLGVIVIAGIFQLGKKTNPIVPDATSAYKTTLSSLFK